MLPVGKNVVRIPQYAHNFTPCLDRALPFSKGEFTQYPFFVRFRPFFYVFVSP